MIFEKRQNLDSTINLRLTKNDKLELKKIAEGENLNITNFIKKLIEDHSNKNKIDKQYLITLLEIHKEIIKEGDCKNIKRSFFQLERGFLNIINKL